MHKNKYLSKSWPELALGQEEQQNDGGGSSTSSNKPDDAEKLPARNYEEEYNNITGARGDERRDLIKNIDLEYRDQYGETFLHHIVWQKDSDLVNDLIKYRSLNLNSLNTAGITPLLSAVIQGDARMVELLLDAGALPSIPDGNGDSPLCIALFNNYYAIANTLVRYGASTQEERLADFLVAVISNKQAQVSIDEAVTTTLPHHILDLYTRLTTTGTVSRKTQPLKTPLKTPLKIGHFVLASLDELNDPKGLQNDYTSRFPKDNLSDFQTYCVKLRLHIASFVEFNAIFSTYVYNVTMGSIMALAKASNSDASSTRKEGLRDFLPPFTTPTREAIHYWLLVYKRHDTTLKGDSMLPVLPQLVLITQPDFISAAVNIRIAWLLDAESLKEFEMKMNEILDIHEYRGRH